MRDTYEINGVLYVRDEKNDISAQPTYEMSSQDLIIPLEVNGKPVKSVYFFKNHYLNDVDRIRLSENIEKIYCDFLLDKSIKVEIDEKNPAYYSDGKAVYTKDLSSLVYFFARADEKYTILDGCKRIEKKAFRSLKHLRRIIFPEGLEVIGEDAFIFCDELEELELPNGLIEVESRAFYACRKLTRVTLPPTLECVGSDAFSGCGNDLTIHIPQAFKEFGESAFSQNWTLELSEENGNFISRGGLILSRDGLTAVYPARPPKDGVLMIPEQVIEIAPGSFCGNELIQKVILPITLHTIGKEAFSSAKALKEINLENVKAIGESAFDGCESLEKVRVNADEIGKNAFCSCYGLVEAEIDCQRTGEAMFNDCDALKRVDLKNTETLSAKTFHGATKLQELVFPQELEKIETLAFEGMRSLTVPRSVRRFGHNFAQGVREIHIYDNIETDIGVDNDISSKNYTLYVHSAETDEIKYAVPIIGGHFGTGFGKDEHEPLVKMFKGGVAFDFERFDRYFSSISDYYLMDKFNAGMLRMEYGYELDEPTRRSYEKQLDELGRFIAEFYIDKDDVEIIFDRRLYTYMSKENLLAVIEKSSRQHLTELTAFLLNISHDKYDK